MSQNPQEELKQIKADKPFFIGIDSDGCVFDTMEIKHKECFCPNFIKHWGLQPMSKYAREIWDFVNLYSKTRGLNRFLALIEAFELLKTREEIIARKYNVQDISSLKEWTEKESKLGIPALEKYAAGTNDPVITRALEWAKAVNTTITEMVFDIAPFPYVRESLEKINQQAISIVVSQTPVEALEREWKENDIDKYVRVIAGQEHGTKSEHIALAAKGTFDDDKILMIGDAPGDLKAAKDNGILFYPINPGNEESSWKRLYEESLDIFFSGKFAGAYEEALIREFDQYLPEKPPWKQH